MKKGRHKKQPKQLKIYQVKARFSEEDYKCILKKADLAGMRPSVFVARAATSADIKEPLTKEILFDIKNLGKIGIILNQIALKINSNPQYFCQEQLHREIQNLANLRQMLLAKLTND